MSLKRKLIGFGFLSLLILLVLFCTLTFLYFYIPTYIESKLIPEAALQAGISDYTCDIRRIGFFGADLGSVRIGNDKNPALSIASAQIDYSPKGLYKKEIKRAVFSGIELFCEYKNGEFRIRQFDLKTFLAQLQSSRKTAPSSTDASQVISIGRLEIRNAVVVFEFKRQRLRLPIELEIVPGKTKKEDTWDAEFFRNWGQAIGMLHRLARQYHSWKASVDPASGEELLTWHEEWASFHSWCPDDEVKLKWVEIKQWLDALPITREVLGFIHNDPHIWNLLVDGDRITLLDSDVANHHWFINGIAIACQNILVFLSGGMSRPVHNRESCLVSSVSLWKDTSVNTICRQNGWTAWIFSSLTGEFCCSR